MPRPVPRRMFSGASGSGTFSGIKSMALVGNHNHQVLAGILNRHFDLARGIVFVAVQHGVDGSFAHRHCDVKALVLVQACLGGQLDPRPLPPRSRFPWWSSAGNSAVLCSVQSPGFLRLHRADAQTPPCSINLAGSFKSGCDCVKRRWSIPSGGPAACTCPSIACGSGNKLRRKVYTHSWTRNSYKRGMDQHIGRARQPRQPDGASRHAGDRSRRGICAASSKILWWPRARTAARLPGWCSRRVPAFPLCPRRK